MYYPHIFIEQCKYKEKEIVIANFISLEIESSSDDDNHGSDKILHKTKTSKWYIKWHSSSYECHSSHLVQKL